MKIYRELYFKGSPKQLSKFVKEIEKYALGDWSFKKENGHSKDYLFFDYEGEMVDKARVCIHLGDDIEKGEIKVVNIVPISKDELTVDEYNSVLLQFYNDIIKPYKEQNTEINISQPSDDSFNPTSIISEEALEKLELFCNAANKSTGSSHPYDKERWFDFICQTVDDGKMFDYSTLSNFLSDESYWGKKPDDFIGGMGRYAWDKEKALELASEYESLCEIVEYYKNKKGI